MIVDETEADNRPSFFVLYCTCIVLVHVSIFVVRAKREAPVTKKTSNRLTRELLVECQV